MWYYQAFGLQIGSDVELLQLPKSNLTKAEIQIKMGDVPLNLEGNYIDYHWIKIKDKEVLFKVEGIASYYIKNGDEITVKIEGKMSEENSPLIQMYLMGTAMGALLIQRSIIPLHGSCIRRKDGKTILFTGDSGAGKSTTAAYFLGEGWSILSDDVTPTQIEKDSVIAYPSFPQQKLWDDALERHDLEEKKVRLLLSEELRKKYSIHNDNKFYDKKESLDIVIQLVPKEQNIIKYREIMGVEKAILLREHTYRNFLYADNKLKQMHFQQCAKMAEKLRIFQICRPIGINTEKQIYEIIELLLEGSSYE